MAQRTNRSAEGRYRAVVGAPRGLRAVMKAGEINRAVEAVEEWRGLERQIRERRVALVTDLRGRGASWDTVGWVLGTTGSAARQRFGVRDG